MELSITEFRRNLFSVVQKAMEGTDVWITHKGRRFCLMPEGKGADKLSRITPMQIVAPGSDLKDDSWKKEIMRNWERKWNRQLSSTSHSQRNTPRKRANASKARGKA
jgi:antitoxin (DNA-binding transcriptional repressor) of toxin-antitoxin stability system